MCFCWAEKRSREERTTQTLDSRVELINSLSGTDCIINSTAVYTTLLDISKSFTVTYWQHLPFQALLFACSVYDSACLLTTGFLDLSFCLDCLIGLMFVLRPLACLLTFAFWINPVFADGSDCYFDSDPLPELTLLIGDSTTSQSSSATHFHWFHLLWNSFEKPPFTLCLT